LEGFKTPPIFRRAGYFNPFLPCQGLRVVLFRRAFSLKNRPSLQMGRVGEPSEKVFARAAPESNRRLSLDRDVLPLNY